MSDNHAARLGDQIIHTTLLADIVSSVAEIATYAAIGMVVGGAIAAAAPLAGGGALTAAMATMGGTAAGATGLAAGAGCVLSGMVGGVLASVTGLADEISSSATALGNLISPPSPAGTINSGSSNVNINGKPAARAAGHATEPEKKEESDSGISFLDMAAGVLGFASSVAANMWQPTVAGADANTKSSPLDTIDCEKHSPQEYLAEGSSNVFINGQPAVRANDRTTCDATISTSVSPDVTIGGGTLTVRPIHSGKLPGFDLGISVIMMLLGRPSKILRNLPCIMMSGVTGYMTNLLTSAVMAAGNPVHAASGVKVLNDDNELDVALPGRFPFRMQRAYNSLNTRDGLFGTGWSTAFDSYLHVDGDQATWYEETGREVQFTLPKPDSMLLSPAEGILVRRNEHGDVVIGDQDSSQWRLFKPTRENPSHLKLAMLCDDYGNSLEMSYDEQGRLVRIHDAAGAVDVTLAYTHPDFPQRVTALSHFDGNQHWPLMQWGYDSRGLLASATDASGVTRREYRYNDDRLMVWHRLPGGLESEYRWEKQDHWRVVENRTSTGEHSKIEYDLVARITTVTRENGAVRRHHWNASQMVTRLEDERGENWLFEWDENDQLLSETDPLGNTWKYVYDINGNQVRVTDPQGNVQSTEWLAHRALPVQVTDPDGNSTHYTYDAHHGLKSITDAQGGTTTVQRDEYGLVISETDPKGGRRHTDYNRAGLVSAATDCSGRTTRYRYHPLGWLLEETAADGTVTGYQYDAAGRPTGLTRPEGWQENLKWSARGLPEWHQTADGRRHGFRYDNAGRLTATQDPEGNTVQREYDARSRLVALRNENGEAYRFTWGDDNLLLAETGLDGVSTRYEYDACGRTLRRTFAAGHADAIIHGFHYDERGLLTARTSPDARTRYQWSKRGQMVSVSRHPALGDGAYSDAAEQVLHFGYNALGQLVSEDGDNATLAWEYDALGNRTQTTLPDGRQLKQFYYGSGHLLSIALDSLPVTDFTRDVLHRETSRTQGVLGSHTRYDALGRLQARDVFSGHPQRPGDMHWRQRWEYDFRNNLVREERNRDPFDASRWSYDSTGKLQQQEDSRSGTVNWPQDGAGNPLAQSGGRVLHNRVTELNGIRWRYDIHGRTVEKISGQQRWRYRYDTEHRLTDVVSETRHRPAVHVSFQYDPLGRRVSKTRWQVREDGSESTRVTTGFVWEGLRLLQEVHGDIPLTYVYADQGSYEPLARIDGITDPEIYWFHCQPNGTPERLTDNEGQVRWDGQTGAWGKLLREAPVHAAGFAQNLRMQGQYLDRETGLHYNLFRYYDPDSGRFTQQDPIGLAGGLNLYQYAPNAQGWVDPLGLSKCNDPSKEATKWQGPGNDDYPGVDVYTNRKLKKGTILYALHPNGNQQPAYTVTYPTIRQFKGDPIGYHQALQIKLDPRWPVRTQARAYYVSEDINVAYGRAGANEIYGKGGGLQFFIPEELRHLLIPGKVIDI
ncbi:type IV secretion protein Rhs [Mangrovibacter sp. MFB070]|uniref:RHS repeat-associated core domain-containing protein n=1 Tax=Mangrovibacter sp. MFB070 TaxID=1224318 RepID=UPI0004D62AB2|nr:RHS repeat-associated core domain-containing protein [Mangrovibacter sp. MFB070]KEA50859.1 type IV secretion protein Rhs [Mangrovibacter sp. MFB070]